MIDGDGKDGAAGDHGGPDRWDFFISYTAADREWAEWIAWTLEETGLRVLVQAWDFVPGSNWLDWMDEGVQRAARTIAVLSEAYTRSVYGKAEWQAAWATDPEGARRRLLVIRVADCLRPGLLAQLVSTDLFGLPQARAQDELLRAARLAISGSRAKPESAPPFPPGMEEQRLLGAVDGHRGKPEHAPPFPTEAERDTTGPGAPGLADSQIFPAAVEYPGEARVLSADPRRLGVRPARYIGGTVDESLPAYVLRDDDQGDEGMRARLARAASDGRGVFLLLVGGSCVGKTRCAYEAVRAVLPEWQLIRPANGHELTVLDGTPKPRTVVWLDEIQRFLDDTPPLTDHIVDRFLTAGAILIGTVWPQWLERYQKLSDSGSRDRFVQQRRALELADQIDLADSFTAAERTRARLLAVDDPRIYLALQSTAGFTQALAGGPQLIVRWRRAKSAEPYAWAVTTAAIDVARLGAHAPLPAGLLRDAAVGYCTPTQRAEAADNWFEAALRYATAKQHGETAMLVPTSSKVATVEGYRVADYLRYHALVTGRSERFPASLWEALAFHLPDPSDAEKLAIEAARRRLDRIAIGLYRVAAEHEPGEYCLDKLLGLLALRGDVEGVKAAGDARLQRRPGANENLVKHLVGPQSRRQSRPAAWNRRNSTRWTKIPWPVRNNC